MVPKNARGISHCRCPRRHIAQDNTHCSDFGSATDADATQDLGVRPEFHIVLNYRGRPVHNTITDRYAMA